MNELPQESESRVALLQAIGQVAHRIALYRENALRERGLSAAKYAVLQQLMQVNGPVTLTQLAGRLTCGKSNITQLIDRLEQDGLVLRVADPGDRRCLRATITEKGLQRYADGLEAEHATERQLLEGIAPEQQQLLAALLEKFHTDM